MKKFFSFRRTKSVSFDTKSALARMERSMPGEAAALASFRLGGMSF